MTSYYWFLYKFIANITLLFITNNLSLQTSIKIIINFDVSLDLLLKLWSAPRFAQN